MAHDNEFLLSDNIIIAYPILVTYVGVGKNIVKSLVEKPNYRDARIYTRDLNLNKGRDICQNRIV